MKYGYMSESVGHDRTRLTGVVLAALAAASLVLASAAAGNGSVAPEVAAGTQVAPGTASVYVVQGLPGEQVEVSVDGRSLAKDAGGGAVLGPFDVAPGEHDLEFTTDSGEQVSSTVDVASGTSSDLVLHVPNQKGAEPLVTVFDNDLSPITEGKARLAVAHTAAVGPADIRVDGKVLFANVANGEGLSLVVPGGTYEVQIVPTGQNGPSVLGPAPLSVEADALNRVYAIGNPTAKTMTVAAHLVPLETTGTAEPGMVDTGTGGQAYRLGLTR